ncbi:Stk1 family PASTA domain-containing Ser/Thr kinase [Aceticella autotrophica]|uniref:non-specific serine/threonine protein kinase n=1 Tax=Aceticella autotrophica TaxID=2755338 RepID=A0A975AUG3_9THEO|nr:Stk1 family PASTA domain-containing Ser/Thr kinase [Aceticella autotrophica]QSZ26670.1 Stk1 family PASTA domain-containing Ser/Thr kinase [Aceticella autotrophica]
MIGRMLGNRYEILEKIGEGGMAKVYKGKCHLLNRIVAIKILRPEFVADEDFVRRFKRESQAAASLSHPNIVSIYDVGQEGDIYYIVMEYVNGKTLKQLIKDNNGPLEISRALDITKQVCKALDHAHRKNIVHRDIKPQNILITDDDIAKVTDFGIARAVNGSTITYKGDVLGTAYYFSPEQAKGNLTDEKTDLYSLGIVMYEMLTGKVPFEGESPISVALKHIQEDVIPPSKINPKVPEKLDQIILKATEKDVNKRYKSALELLNDINTFLNDPDKLNIVKPMDNNKTQIISANDVQKIKKISNDNRPKKGSRILKKVGIILLVLLLMAGLSYATMLLLNNFSKVGDVIVPNVVGQSIDKANNILESHNLKMNISSYQYSDKGEGIVISQTPKSGQSVKKGSIVNVVVSRSKQFSTVPNVTNLEYREALMKLENSGLKGNIIQKYNDKFPQGYVFDQNPRQGVQVEYGSTIDIYVSQGIETVKMPSLINMTLDDAQKTLNALGLKTGNITYQQKDNVPNNTVIGQSIPENTDVQKGKTVDLIVVQNQQTSPGNNNPVQPPLNSGTAPSPSKNNKTKNLSIDLPNKSGTMKVDVYTIQNGVKNLQYSASHTSKDSPITVPITGSGNLTIEVDIDGSVYKTMEAKF